MCTTTSDNVSTSKRKSYSASFKLQVLTFAVKNGVRNASREFAVQPNMIRYWRKQQEKLVVAKKNVRSFRGPQTGKYSEVDKKVLVWVQETRNNGYSVSHEMLQIQAREIAKNDEISGNEFKASRGWAVRFMRNNLALQMRTSLCQ